MSEQILVVSTLLCFGFTTFLFIFGFYSLVAGIYMYRTDKFPSYFREPILRFGSPKMVSIGVIIRGVFAIIFGLIVVLTTILQG